MSFRVGEELAQSKLRSLAVLDCDNVGSLDGLSRLLRLDVQGKIHVSETLFRQLEAVSATKLASLPSKVRCVVLLCCFLFIFVQLNGALTKLALRDCALTDDGIKSVLRGCKFLAHVDLSTSGASEVSDEAFEEGLSSLEQVNLSGHTGVGDAGVGRLIGASRSGLAALALRGLQVSAALFAAGGLPRLAALDCAHCPRMGTGALQSLAGALQTPLQTPLQTHLQTPLQTPLHSLQTPLHSLQAPLQTRRLVLAFCPLLVLDSALLHAVRAVADLRCDGLVVRGPLVLACPKNLEMK